MRILSIRMVSIVIHIIIAIFIFFNIQNNTIFEKIIAHEYILINNYSIIPKL